MSKRVPPSSCRKQQNTTDKSCSSQRHRNSSTLLAEEDTPGEVETLRQNYRNLAIKFPSIVSALLKPPLWPTLTFLRPEKPKGLLEEARKPPEGRSRPRRNQNRPENKSNGSEQRLLLASKPSLMDYPEEEEEIIPQDPTLGPVQISQEKMEQTSQPNVPLMDDMDDYASDWQFLTGTDGTQPASSSADAVLGGTPLPDYADLPVLSVNDDAQLLTAPMYYRAPVQSSARRYSSDLLIRESRRDGRLTRVSSRTEVSSVSVPRCHELLPAFTSLRHAAKPQSPGLTIVNVYEADRERLVPEQRKVVKVRKVERSLKREEEVQDGHRCLAMDEKRQRVLKREQLLPRWNQREEVLVDDYDSWKAKQDWDEFYEGKGGKRTDCCRCEAKETSEVAVTMTDACPGAFYGSAEAQKICQTAIQQLLKCEKKLRQLQFATGTRLPGMTDCLEKVHSVHDCLKLFHTHFRDLQAETDEQLQKKTGNHFTIRNQPPPPKHRLPFPRHIH